LRKSHTDGIKSIGQTVYNAVKAVNPNVLVTTPTVCRNKTTNAQAMDSILAVGAGAFADVVTFHGYIAGVNSATASHYPQGVEIVRLWDSGVRWSVISPSRGSYNWSNHVAKMRGRFTPSVPKTAVVASESSTRLVGGAMRYGAVGSNADRDVVRLDHAAQRVVAFCGYAVMDWSTALLSL
jgi:glutamate synthase domain-containing protein 2